MITIYEFIANKSKVSYSFLFQYCVNNLDHSIVRCVNSAQAG